MLEMVTPRTRILEVFIFPNEHATCSWLGKDAKIKEDRKVATLLESPTCQKQIDIVIFFSI